MFIEKHKGIRSTRCQECGKKIMEYFVLCPENKDLRREIICYDCMKAFITAVARYDITVEIKEPGLNRFDIDRTGEPETFICPECGCDSIDRHQRHCHCCGIRINWPDRFRLR